MTANDILRENYIRLGFKSISAFIKSINSCLSLQTWTRMLNKNGNIDLRTLLISSAELKIPSAQLKFMLELRGEKIIAGLITPSEIGIAEQNLLEKYWRLAGDPAKRQLIHDMLDHLQPCDRCGKTKPT